MSNNSSTSIKLVRHAESYWNSERIFVNDVTLTDKGIEQSKKINLDTELVLCSKLMRARQTLENSNIKYKEVIYTDLCREIRDGNIINIIEGESNVKETYEDRLNRAEQFRQLLREYSKKYSSIVVVSHAIFLSDLCGKKMWNNCEVYDYVLE